MVVLCEKLQTDPETYGGKQNAEVFLALIQRYEEELREKSLSLGARVYEQKPKALARDMSKLWDAWQEQPASMKAEEKEQRLQRKGPAQVKAKRAVA